MRYLLIIFVIQFSVQSGSAQPVKDGVFTLNDNLIRQNDGISLQGRWFFQFDTISSELVDVPKSWIYYEVNGRSIPSKGEAVYSLKINNPDRQSDLALLLYGITLDYQVLANDQIIYQSKGYLPPELQSGIPARSRDLIPMPNESQIELNIQVKNNEHYDGGLTKAPVLGLMSNLKSVELSRSNFEMVQIGCLLLMAIYNLVLLFQFRNSSYLYLSILCFIVLIRGLIVFDGSLMLYHLLPEMSYGLSKKIEFFSVYATIFIPPLFLQSLFKDHYFKKAIKVLTGVGALLMGVVLFTPTHTFTATLNFYHLMMIPSFVVVFGIVIRAIKDKKVGAQLVSLGILISFIFVAIEIMINSGLVELYHGGPNLVNTGTVVFLFIQSVVISQVFAHYREETFKKSIELSKTEEARKNMEIELGDKEKELADYTLSMIQRNRLLEEMDQIISETKTNKETETVASVLNKFDRLTNLNRQSNNQWEDFNRYFGNVHHDFFNKLKTSYPQISGNDLRHCALIKMNLSLKESAEILGVDVGSVKVARYRMKRKMDLNEEDDLRQVIANI